MTTLSAQFSVSIQGTPSFKDTNVYLYTISGSKDILISKVEKKKDNWTYAFPEHYEGMLKAYFPDSNQSFTFVSENKNVMVRLSFDGKEIKTTFADTVNQKFKVYKDIQSKREDILPALYQLETYYDKDSDFNTSLQKEISRLSKNVTFNSSENPFLLYFKETYDRFLTVQADKPEPSQEQIIEFLVSTNQYLETSGLLRPILVNYLTIANKSNAESSINKLLKSVDEESSRGQIILSELIEIFDIYGLSDLKKKYLEEAQNLKCTINDHLASTIKVNKMLDIGAVFPDYKFKQASNTNAQSINSVKANKKVIVFWSSTCSHCEQEIPEFLPLYNTMTKNNIQIIGLALDTDETAYNQKVKSLPWINDTELKGWNSSFSELYNIHATPTYFVLDENNKIIAKPDHARDVLNFLNLK